MASENLETWHDLSGKVVMVTGASSVLGREFCVDLTKAGCHVIAAARRFDRLKSLCDQIKLVVSPTHSSPSSGVRAVTVELDGYVDGPIIEKSVWKAWEAFGRIDALINNAGF